MRTSVVALMTSVFGLGFVGCGYIDGPCWRRSEDGAGVGAGSGVGGGPLFPAGAGGYGDVSAEPQNAGSDEDMPIECWTEGCKDGCDRQQEEDLNTCQKIPAEKQEGCRQRAREKATTCHKECDKKKCAEMFERCNDIGGECTKAYPGCDTWGKSACRSCQEACMAGVQYPPKCHCGSCGFTE